MRAPAFWQTSGALAQLLQPLASLLQLFTCGRTARAIPYRARVPVLCVGNAIAGGAGKTPTVALLATMLAEQGITPHILSRGYGGTLAGPLAVDPQHHTAAQVGDEPLLLARQAPVWISRARAAGLRALEAAGASAILMDDGLQNPHVAPSAALLVVDGGYGIGNGRCLPAGPLREPWPQALARAQAVLIIGEDRTGIAARCGSVPVLYGHLQPETTGLPVADQAWLAFAGIGRPQKFFETLAAHHFSLADCIAFADHHPYLERELRDLAMQAERYKARLITTEKDAVRLPAAWRARVAVLPVRLVLQPESQRWVRHWLASWSAPC
jgi:tetraacyldisaccharide 4'-kinase